MAYSIGLSTCSKNPDRAFFAACKEAGIDCVELSQNAEDFAELDFAAVKKYADEYGVTLQSMHIPFAPFYFLDPSDEEKQNVTLAYFYWCIQKGADIGIRTFVVHPSAEPIAEDDRAHRLQIAKQTLAQLADFAARHDAVIAVENLPRTCLGRDSKDILALLEAHPALRCCYDTNHLLSEDAVDFIHAVGDKIVTTHVSDYDFLNERHWLPGEGKVDWTCILQALDEVGYKGAWLYEVSFTSPKTIVRAADLNCVDIAENARALFENRTLPMLGCPVEGLKGWK